ncbi:MAG: PorT family protein [Bernardetiaceae bacterium]|nr:PorT family protein [Bernardetiaceae bacterium]
MKKAICLAALVWGLAGLPRAQAQLLSFGPRVGLSMSDLSGLPTNADNGTYRPGVMAGAWGRLKIPVIGLFVQPELLYVQKGGNYTVSGTNGTYNLAVNQLDVPVLFGIQFFRTFRGYLGPVYSRTLDSQLSGPNLPGSEVPGIYRDSRSAVFGLGVNFKKLEIDARFITRSNPIASSTNLRTGGFQITAAYRL